MIGIIALNILILALGIVVAAGFVSTVRVSGMLDWLHAIIGITPPPLEKARFIALIWIGSMLVIVDGLLFLLVFLTRHIM